MGSILPATFNKVSDIDNKMEIKSKSINIIRKAIFYYLFAAGAVLTPFHFSQQSM